MTAVETLQLMAIAFLAGAILFGGRRKSIYRIKIDDVEVQGESESDCRRLLELAEKYRS